MRTTILCFGTTLLLAAPLHADLLDSVKSLPIGSAASSPNSLGGVSMPSLDSVGLDNLTGVLQYCIKNNYLGGDSGGVAGQLTSMLGGEQKAKASPDYQSGLQGILGGKSDQTLDLSGSSMTGKLADQVCDKVLEYGKSMLK